MTPTPLGPLLARSLRGRCPVCGRGPLFAGLFTLRDVCPLCGYRFHRAVEYGGQGFLSGAISINVLLTGGVLAAALIVVAANGWRVPLPTQFLLGGLWSVLFPLAFHRTACAVWVALDLRLNPPTVDELAAAPPRERPPAPPAPSGRQGPGR